MKKSLFFADILSALVGEQFDYHVSCYGNFYDNEPIPMAIKQIHLLVTTDEKLRSITEAHRKQKAIAENFTLSGPERMKAKKEAEKLKHSIYTIIPGALCKDGKDRNSIQKLLPTMGIDLDDIHESRMVEVRQALESSPYIIFRCDSPSGQGQRAVIHISEINVLQELWDSASNSGRSQLYKFAYKQVADYIEELTGVKVDMKCGNPEHSFSIPFDEHAYFNESPEAFSISMEGFSLPQRGRKQNVDEKAPKKGKRKTHRAGFKDAYPMISELMRKKGITIENGRNNYLFHFACLCNLYGVEDDDVKEWANENLLEDDFDEKEICSAIQSAYKRTEDFGTRALQDNYIDFIASVLHSIADFRYNTLTEHTEIKYKEVSDAEDDEAYTSSVKSSHEWHPVDDRIFNDLYTTVRNKIKTSKGDVESTLTSPDFAAEYDPICEYIKGCPKWDPSQKDYIDDFFGHIQLMDECHSPIIKKYCHKWFVNFVSLALGVTKDNQLVLCLIGGENLGKTYLCKKILPPELSDYYQRVDPNDPLDKDFLISIGENYLINFDERKIARGSESAMFKSVVSGGSKKVRKPYGRFPKNIEPHSSFVLTNNELVFIGEEEGNRRYISVHVKDTLKFNVYPIDYQRLYAQAMYEIEHGQSVNYLTQEEVAELKQLNKEYTEVDPMIDAILTYFKPCPIGTPESKWYTSTMIVNRITGSGNMRSIYSGTSLGNALRKLGFEKRKSGTNKYLVLEVKIDSKGLDIEPEPEPEPPVNPLQTVNTSYIQALDVEVTYPSLDELYDRDNEVSTE